MFESPLKLIYTIVIFLGTNIICLLNMQPPIFLYK